MKQSTGERETFVVRILNTQNATWQGTVTWTDGRRTEPFRSALELIRLIDSTLLEQEEEGDAPGRENCERGAPFSKSGRQTQRTRESRTRAEANRPKGRDAKPGG